MWFQLERLPNHPAGTDFPDSDEAICAAILDDADHKNVDNRIGCAD